jgi:hypothetical protein
MIGRRSNIHSRSTIIHPIAASTSSSILETLIAARQSLSRAGSRDSRGSRGNRGNRGGNRGSPDPSLEYQGPEIGAWDHQPGGMSPWNEQSSSTNIDMSVPKSHARRRKRKKVIVEKEIHKSRPSISMEIQGLFAHGSRIEDEDTRLVRNAMNAQHHQHQHQRHRRSRGGGSTERTGAASRALSPFSEWMERTRLSSPDMLQPPMSADVHSSEFYQLKYNRASTVTSGQARNRKEEKHALKLLNEKRAKMLLTELKETIQKKKRNKKQALAQNKMFVHIFELREKVTKPLPKPTNCHLPGIFAPNQHPSHPIFSQFFPEHLEKKEALGKALGMQLSHSRLESYQFNVKSPPPLMTKEEENQFQRELLESQGAQQKQLNQQLAASFWTRITDQEGTENILSDIMTSLNLQKTKMKTKMKIKTKMKTKTNRRRRKHGGIATDTGKDQEDEVPVKSLIPAAARHPKIFFPTRAQREKGKTLELEKSIYLNYFSPAV